MNASIVTGRFLPASRRPAIIDSVLPQNWVGMQALPHGVVSWLTAHGGGMFFATRVAPGRGAVTRGEKAGSPACILRRSVSCRIRNPQNIKSGPGRFVNVYGRMAEIRMV